MTGEQWVIVMARIREAWPEPLVPRYYEALRQHDQETVLEAIEGLLPFCKALPPPGRFLAAVAAVQEDRRRTANAAPLPEGRPASPVDRAAAYRAAVDDAIETECAGLEGEEREQHAQAIRERYASYSSGIAAALGLPWPGSNRRPPGYEPGELPSAPHGDESIAPASAAELGGGGPEPGAEPPA